LAELKREFEEGNNESAKVAKLKQIQQGSISLKICTRIQVESKK